MAHTPHWSASPALARAVGLPIVLGAAALVLGRVELLLLGLPLALSAALALSSWGGLGELVYGRRDDSPPPTVKIVGPRTVDEGRTTRLGVTISASPAEIVTVTLPPEEQDQRSRRVTVLVGHDHDIGSPSPSFISSLLHSVGGSHSGSNSAPGRQIVTETRALTWGQQMLGRPDHVAGSPDGYFVSGPEQGPAYYAHVLPAISQQLQTGPLPPRPSGMVGAHRTRRRGDGTDLYDISVFRPGDRLRRIDWRVTARHASPREELYTRHTLVDADADVVCCLDNRYDLRSDVTTWGKSMDAADYHAARTDAGPGPNRTSVDIAVDTVASLAAAYLAHGDRVGVIDLARPMEMTRLGSGSRHLLRLRTHLARHTRRPGSGDSASLPRRVPSFPPGAIVVVTSAFLEDGICELIVSLRRAGHAVVAVDVMPPLLPLPAKAGSLSLALRMVLAERSERMAGLTAHGVLMSPADPSQLWINLARLAREPHRIRR